MAIRSAQFPSIKVLTPTPVATATPIPHFSLTGRQAYLMPLLAPIFIFATILIVSKIFSKKSRVLRINNESLKILLLVAILTTLLIIAWQTRYEYIQIGYTTLRLDKLTRTVEIHRLLEEIRNPISN